MANIISMISRNISPGRKRVSASNPDIFILKVDAAPGSGLGTEAPVGSFASYDGLYGAEIYYKYGSLNTDWRLFANSDGSPESLITISGNHQALENPTTVEELVDFMDSTYQPLFSTQNGPYTIYVRTDGDDENNTGLSSDSGFLTIERAIQKVATLNGGGTVATIDIGAGTFNWPRVIACNFTDFRGNTTIDATLTIDTVIASDNINGIVIDVTSTGGPYTEDELRGKHLSWTSGVSNGNPGWIYRNDATVSGVTRIYATHDSGSTTAIESMIAGDTISVISQNTTLNCLGATILINSVQMNIYNARFSATAGTVFQCINTDKIQFFNCYFDGAGQLLRVFRVGGFGRAYLTTCYVATSGTSTLSFLQCQNNGFLQIERGTVLDPALNGIDNPNARVVSGVAGSLLAFQGHVVCRGFNTTTKNAIFLVDGLGIFQVGGTTAYDNILVEDKNGASTYQNGPVFKMNSTGAGQGGWYQLPRLHGSIVKNYSVEAQNCACVIIGDSPGTSTISTAIGTNTVSADAGVSNIAANTDLTYVRNGTPSVEGFKRVSKTIEVTGTSYSLENDNGIILINQAADSAVTINLPPGNDHLTKEVIIKDKKGTAGTRNITINPDGAETIDGSLSALISTNYESLHIIFSGTDWSII